MVFHVFYIIAYQPGEGLRAGFIVLWQYFVSKYKCGNIFNHKNDLLVQQLPQADHMLQEKLLVMVNRNQFILFVRNDTIRLLGKLCFCKPFQVING